MDLKYNINKIHSDLLTEFDDVKIVEKSDKKNGNYFSLSVINESKEVKMIINKKSVENNDLKWSYYSNPLDENSMLVERSSSIDDIKVIIRDIFEKNRFDSDYITTINNK